MGCCSLFELDMAVKRQHRTVIYETERRLALLRVACFAGSRAYRSVKRANRLVRRVAYLLLGLYILFSVACADANM